MILQEVGNEELEVFKKVIDFSVPGKNFLLKENDKTIGYSRINDLEEDNIFVYIIEEFRGNGHGKELFKLSFEKLPKDEIILNVSKQNIQMQKIIENYQNIKIINEPKYIKYALKK